MITNFEDVTETLNAEEMALVPVLIKGFKTHTEKNPIKAPEIVAAINEKKEKYGLRRKFTEARLRKICNYIRVNSLLPLIATSAGYYVSKDEKVISGQIKSLQERAGAILKSADGLKPFIKK